MGNCLGGLFRRKKLRRNIVLLLIGLDNAGKTKTMNNLAGENDAKVLPTVGFKAVNLVHKDTPVTIYDLGGSPEFRQIWHQYYSEIHGVIFVMDSSDLSRLDECKAVLEEVISHDKISGKPILVLANKQDKHGALDDIDIVEKLQIEPLVNKYRCPTLVESYSAAVLPVRGKPKLDPGLKKGYQWLLNYILRRYGDINLRVQTDIHADLERRKRLLQLSTRASQTFSGNSDDIATQTGFENPNYETPRKSHIENPTVIIVRENHKQNQTNTTLTNVTIESIDTTTDNTSKPISPFDDKNIDSNDRSLDSKRSERRVKLSPIKMGLKSIDFDKRPQSSPNSKLQSPAQSTPTRSTKTSNITPIDTSTVSAHSAADSVSFEGNKTRIVAVRKEHTLEIGALNRGAMSEVALAELTSTLPAARPASASQVVRTQLELASAHKRRLSLRYIPRNKTSPERLGIFHYEPTKAAPKKLSDGPETCHSHADVAL